MTKLIKSATDVAVQAEAPSTMVAKLDQVVALLSRPQGASLAEMCTATGWQTHSARGALAGLLKRKGHVVTSDNVEGVRRYGVGVPA